MWKTYWISIEKQWMQKFKGPFTASKGAPRARAHHGRVATWKRRRHAYVAKRPDRKCWFECAVGWRCICHLSTTSSGFPAFLPGTVKVLALSLHLWASLSRSRYPTSLVPLSLGHHMHSPLLSLWNLPLSLLLDAPRCRHRALRSNEGNLKWERSVLWQQGAPLRAAPLSLAAQRLS